MSSLVARDQKKNTHIAIQPRPAAGGCPRGHSNGFRYCVGVLSGRPALACTGCVFCVVVGRASFPASVLAHTKPDRG